MRRCIGRFCLFQLPDFGYLPGSTGGDASLRHWRAVDKYFGTDGANALMARDLRAFAKHRSDLKAVAK